MERFCDIFGHPHELVIRGGWRHALRHRMANGLYGVAEIGRERCRGAPDEVFRGGRLSSSKLHHDVGEREGEAAQVLPGRLGSQEDAELMPQPPKVKVEELTTPAGTVLWCMQPQLLEHLGDRVDAGIVGVERR